MPKNLTKCKARNPATCWKHGHSKINVDVISKKIHSTETLPKSDVSGFEKKFKELFKNFIEGKEVDYSILLLTPKTNQPIIFRDFETIESLKNVFASLEKELKQNLNTDKLYLTGDNNNRSGADLYESFTDIHIELKLGSATDANLGLESMKDVLGLGLINSLPTAQQREKWRASYLLNPEQTSILIKAEHKKSYESFVKDFQLKAGDKLDPAGQLAMNKYWSGNNNNNLSGRMRRWQLLKDGTWKEEIKSLPSGSWQYGEAEVKTQPDKTNRLNFSIYNPVLEKSLKLTYNYKNTYRSKTLGIVAPAKLGLGSPSFNGWWR